MDQRGRQVLCSSPEQEAGSAPPTAEVDHVYEPWSQEPSELPLSSVKCCCHTDVSERGCWRSTVEESRPPGPVSRQSDAPRGDHPDEPPQMRTFRLASKRMAVVGFRALRQRLKITLINLFKKIDGVFHPRNKTLKIINRKF